jgi:thiol-disulfide isomerase/thioredoxin
MKVSDSLKQKFIVLFKQWKGTNLLIDFWGDWCGPCMMEMPGYPKLIAAFENKPLKFIFFSSLMIEKSMLAVKKQYHINADFINLSKDEVAVMNNLFEFHSYPTHILVNTSGSVVSNNTKSEAGITKLLFP